MLSKQYGANTSAVELTNVSAHGFWLLCSCEEYFLAFEDFPWFRDASIAALSNIEVQGAEHLYWPDLYVDLPLAIIKKPGDYPLESKE